MKHETYKKLEKFLGRNQIEEKKDLFPYLTIRTHIKAEFFFEGRDRDDLVRTVLATKKLNIPLFFLGGGSNLAPLSNKISGLVVRNAYIKKEIIGNEKEFVKLLVSSGYPVSQLVAQTLAAGWGGFEYHQGLPGTVGGAIYMNSKWTHPVSYFGDNLLYAYLIDDWGKVKKVNRKYFQFGYDFSILQKTKEILLEAVFRLKKTSPAILKKRAEAALAYRKRTQPLGVATSGCFFRNVNGTISAGYLIDKAGLKGYTVGNFYVSPLHANFIINRGNGHPADLSKLLRIIKKRVRDKFGVELEEEVILI